MRSNARYLQKVAVVSTGYALNQQNLDGITQKLREAFPSFEFVVPPDLLSIECQKNNTGNTMLCNTAEMRARHVINALIDPSITAIWCMTGSEGASEVIDHIADYDKKVGLPRPEHPKPFIGMSDVTILHVYLGQERLAKPIHASLLTTLFVPSLKPKFKNVVNEEIKLIENLITNTTSSLTLSTNLRPLNRAAKNASQLNGPIIGGCTELLLKTKGTDFELKTDGAIIVLESLDHIWVENGGIHAINTLAETGLFKNVGAIVFGGIESFKGSKLADKALATEESKRVRENFFRTYQYQIEQFARKIDVPVFDNFRFGHTLDMINTPIPLYTSASINLDDNENAILACDPSFIQIPGAQTDKSLKLLTRGTLFSKDFKKTNLSKAIRLISLSNCEKNAYITAPMIGGMDMVAVDKETGKNNTLNTSGRILFLGFESKTDQYIDLQAKMPMYLHAMLVHFKQSGIFNATHALIFGAFPFYSKDKNKQSIFENSLIKIILDFFAQYNIDAPIFMLESQMTFPNKFQLDNVTIYTGSKTKDAMLFPSYFLQPFFVAKKKKPAQLSSQHTLNASIKMQGVGFHTNSPSAVTLLPAPPDTGIIFQRTDIARLSKELGCLLQWEVDSKGKRTGNFIDAQGKIINSQVKATFSNVTNTALSTNISNTHKVNVRTIEHFMSALMVAGIDNAIILIDGPELPIMDGSCSYIYNAIKLAGRSVQNTERNVVIITAPVKYYDKHRDATFSIQPADHFEACVSISFDNPVIGESTITVDSNNMEEVMNARTFAFEEHLRDANRLFARSISSDGSKRGAIVVGKNNIVVNDKNNMHTSQLRTQKEFVQHKTLDALGDIATGGSIILGKFELNRSGHEVNNKGMRALYASSNSYVVMRWSDAMEYIKNRANNSKGMRAKL